MASTPSEAVARVKTVLATLERPDISISVVGADGEPIYSHHASALRTPASVLKLISVGAALDELGQDYRFETHLYHQGETLFIQGRGDPMLVSEEWENLIAALPNDLRFTHLVLDDSFFSENLGIIQEPEVYDPYNALNAAFATNFNTIAFTLSPDGKAIPESQTPWVDFVHLQYRPARRIAHTRVTATHEKIQVDIAAPKSRATAVRVHLGFDRRAATLYAGHLFVALAKRRERHFEPESIGRGAVPKGIAPLYVHRNTHPLREILEGLLKYSNNFIANQVLLVAGAHQMGDPAAIDKAVTLIRTHAAKGGIRDFELHEASGLDPRNRLRASDLASYLAWAARWHPTYPTLLQSQSDGLVRAKTGTFAANGVRSLAGFVMDAHTPKASFAMICNGRRCRADTARQFEAAAKALAGCL